MQTLILVAVYSYFTKLFSSRTLCVVFRLTIDFQMSYKKFHWCDCTPGKEILHSPVKTFHIADDVWLTVTTGRQSDTSIPDFHPMNEVIKTSLRKDYVYVLLNGLKPCLTAHQVYFQVPKDHLWTDMIFLHYKFCWSTQTKRWQCQHGNRSCIVKGINVNKDLCEILSSKWIDEDVTKWITHAI